MATEKELRPVRTPDDLLQFPFATRRNPLPPPNRDIFDTPHACVRINQEWVAHIIGALEALNQPDSWSGTDDQQFNARQQIQKLLDALKNDGDCGPCETDQSCVSYYPQHPAFEFAPGQINGTSTPPAGYLNHPWFTGDKLTIPGFTFQATDVLCNLASVASVGLGLIDQITQSGLPRFRFTFEGGPGTVQLHLLNVELGGLAIIRLDERQNVQVVNLQSIGLSDLVPSTEWILTLLGLVTSGINGTTIIEVDIPNAGAHTIDVLMSPYVEFPNVLASGWGGGIRKIVICGSEVSCEDQVCPDCPDPDCENCEDCGDSDCDDCSDCDDDCDECEECE